MTGGSRRSAPHRLCIGSGVADTSCYSGTRGTVGSGPLPVAPLHLGSPRRSAAERFRASSLGFGMARCRRGPSRTGHRAHRVGLSPPQLGGLFLGSWPGRHPRFPSRLAAHRPGERLLTAVPLLVLQYQQPRLPIEASPAKVASDEQHNDDDDDDPNPGHVILSLGACRLYGESVCSCNGRGRRGEVPPATSERRTARNR